MEAWLWAMVNGFWETVGDPPPFPRDLESVLPFGYQLTVERIPDLKVSVVEAWLQRRGREQSFGCRDRQLSACLVAFGQAGIIFLCDGDDSAEQRFSVAHETGHFLTDFLTPRRRAVESLGPGILSVLDGHRPPTVDERLGAVLEGVPLGLYRDLMPRSASGDIESGYVLRAEERADWVGMELLAPRDEVCTMIQECQALFSSRGAAAQAIGDTFGLPPRIASQYLNRIAPLRGQSMRTWLGVP